jgi:UDP-glucose:glycoprotein glucosyltransferase
MRWRPSVAARAALCVVLLLSSAAAVHSASSASSEHHPDLRVRLSAQFTRPLEAHETAEIAAARGGTRLFLECARSLAGDSAPAALCGDSELRSLALGLGVFAPAVESHRQLGRTAATSCAPLHLAFHGSADPGVAGGAPAADAVFHFSEGQGDAGHVARGAVVPFFLEKAEASSKAVTAAAAGIPSGSAAGLSEKCGLDGFVAGLDHTLEGNGRAPDVRGVLYANAGSAAFGPAVDLAQKLLDDGLVSAFAFRHYAPGDMGDLDAPGARPMSLPGYGVELALKKLEYRTVDERASHAEAEETETDLPDEVDGFDFSVLKQREPAAAKRLDAFRAHLLSTEVELEDLKIWDLKDLDFLSAQRVMAAAEAGTNPLAALADVAQNIPLLAPKLVRLRLNQTLKQEFGASRTKAKFEAGTNRAILNGREINPEATDIFDLFNKISAEATKFRSLRALGIPESSASAMLDQSDEDDTVGSVNGIPASTLRVLTSGPDLGGGTSPSRFDVRADNLFWMNNFDHDSRYQQWTKNVNGMFQRVWPGSFRQVARDMFTMVAIGDPSELHFLQLGATCQQAINQNLPIRFGLWLVTEDLQELYDRFAGVPASGDPVSDLISVLDRDTLGYKVAKLIWYIAEEKSDRDGAITFISQLSGRLSQKLQTGEGGLHFDRDVSPIFASTRDDLPYASTVVAQSDLDAVERIIAGQNLRAFEVFGSDTLLPVAFMNGEQCSGSSGPEMVQSCLQSSMRQTPGIQRRVRGQRIVHGTADIYAQLLDPKENSDVFSRFNQRLLPDEHTNPLVFVSLAGESARGALGIGQTSETRSSAVSWLSNPRYRDSTKAVSVLVAGNLASIEGATLAVEALRVLQQVPDDPDVEAPDDEDVKRMRVGFLHTGRESSYFADAIDAIVTTQLSRRAFNLAAAAARRNVELLREGKVFDRSALQPILEAHAGVKIDKIYDTIESSASRSELRAAATSALELTANAALVINGRIVVVHDSVGGESMACTAPDVRFLVQYERRERGDRIADKLSESVQFEGIGEDALSSDFISDIVMATASVLASDTASGEETSLPPALDEPGVVSFDVGSKTAPVDFVAILDPLSKATQRLAPMLHSLASFLPELLRVRVILSPRELSELPIKSFYRYVVPTAQGTDVSAVFDRLPPERLLTTNLDEPRSWLVSASKTTPAFADLDNLQVSAVHDHWRAEKTEQRGVEADFTLDHVLVEGHCYDISNIHESGVPQPVPPTGLEIVLKPDSRETVGDDVAYPDTMVMSNLGYFQLKANPGAYRLAIKPQTRSEKLYRITSATDPRTLSDDGNDDAGAPFDVPFSHVAITTFAPTRQTLHVRKHPEHFGESLLGGNDAVDDGFGLGSFFGGDSPAKVAAEDSANETVHVFSLASGKLYERFLSIMMLSVVKNTAHPVKFWFLANFLSPEFKSQAPVMAAKLGFEVEFVTYKWPDWLNGQTEKQRIIWGHKILFMDVLFPLDVKKIVYVDADQVVRGDLHELWEMDLGGAPYAYTPFCLPPNDNKDTTGFRFWASGFWKSHLGAKPYHISALYYVDLERFRQMGAGDTLRQTYHSLSQDPNSLSNLDQDLPNYLQRAVPIHSLPQEWLWCETWCSNGIKPKAKTIDLCNNPLTKTPKLEAARTIIPEWEDLDREAGAALRGE